MTDLHENEKQTQINEIIAPINSIGIYSRNRYKNPHERTKRERPKQVRWDEEKKGELKVGMCVTFYGEELIIDEIRKIGSNITNIYTTRKNGGGTYAIIGSDITDFLIRARPISCNIKEDIAPTNVTGATVATDEPIVRRERFANKEVFEVDDCFYQKCIHGKPKYRKYEDYVGNDATGEAIRQFGRANPKSSILVKNKNTQAMMYLRRINEETGEEMFRDQLDESALSPENIATLMMLAGSTATFAHGYYEMSRDAYYKLKAVIEKRNAASKQAGGGILTNYREEIDSVTKKLEAIFAKAKIVSQ